MRPRHDLLPRMLLALAGAAALASASGSGSGSGGGSGGGSDAFGDPSPLIPGETVDVDLVGATSEASEPAHPSPTVGWSRWWRLTPTQPGRLIVRVDRSSPLLPYLFAVRGSAGPGGFVHVADNALPERCPVPFAPHRHWDFAIDARPGEDVVLGADIAIDEILRSHINPDGTVGVDYGGPTQFRFSVEFRPAPDHDAFQTPRRLAADFSSLDADLLGASAEPGEPLAPGSLGRTVWYQWTAPSDGQLSVGPGPRRTYKAPASTAAPSTWADTASLSAQWGLVALPYWLPVGYAGGGVLGSVGVVITTGGGGGIVNPPPRIDCRPIPSSLTIPVVPSLSVFTGDAIDGLSVRAQGRQVAFTAVAGTTYRIALDATEGEAGTVHLDAAFTPAPVNDDVARALPISGTSSDVVGHTIAATREGFEGGGPRSVWWSWLAESEGPTQLEAGSPDAANVRLEVRAEPQDGAPRLLAAGPNAVSFYASQGSRYWISVAPEESPGDYVLRLRQVPARLRPVVIHPGNPRSGLVIAESGWRRALLQQASGGQWSDRGIVVPQAGAPDATTVGYYLPVDVPQLDPSAAGLFRVWLLDFELPVPSVAMVGVPTAVDGGQMVQVELKASPGRVFDVESSADLVSWGSVSAGNWSVGLSRIPFVLPADAAVRFFRVRERVVTALPLTLGR